MFAFSEDQTKEGKSILLSNLKIVILQNSQKKYFISEISKYTKVNQLYWEINWGDLKTKTKQMVADVCA